MKKIFSLPIRINYKKTMNFFPPLLFENQKNDDWWWCLAFGVDNVVNNCLVRLLITQKAIWNFRDFFFHFICCFFYSKCEYYERWKCVNELVEDETSAGITFVWDVIGSG